MNLLKKYKEHLEATVMLGAIPAMVIISNVLHLCKHC